MAKSTYSECSIFWYNLVITEFGILPTSKIQHYKGVSDLKACLDFCEDLNFCIPAQTEESY